MFSHKPPGCLAALAWLPALLSLAWLGGCSVEQPAPAGPPPTLPRWLTIVTPHKPEIQRAFGTAFSNWYFRDHKELVYVDWVERGTPECVSYSAEAVHVAGEREARMPADLMFGGGITDHQYLADNELSLAIELNDAVQDIPAQVAGLPTRDVQGRWYATGLSSFGFLFNGHRLEQRGIAPPRDWEDLADPRFYSWLGVADPSGSGSHLQCLIIMVQKYGWEQGWSHIIRTLANSRALVDRSSAAIAQTHNGIFLVALSVNFEGLAAQAESNSQLRYLNPGRATAATPDVISVLRSSKQKDLAVAFVRFCLSEEGQKLWGATVPEGSQRFPLYHYPIDPKLYHKPEQLSVPENPYETSFGIRYDLERAMLQAPALTTLVGAACGENHVLLQQAWEAVIRAGLPGEALTELCTPPLSEAEALDLGRVLRSATDQSVANQSRSDLATRFAAKFRKVIELAGAPQ